MPSIDICIRFGVLRAMQSLSLRGEVRIFEHSADESATKPAFIMVYLRPGRVQNIVVPRCASIKQLNIDSVLSIVGW
jgi:hypothetical protein